MALSSSFPSSRRGYLSQDELAQMANITIVDTTEADDRISQAEEMIDAYVGPQDKHMDYEVCGMVTAASSNTVTLDTIHQNNMDTNYLRLCQIEILGGTGEGQRQKIIGSTKPGVVTIDTTWTTTPDTTSFYRITQLGKFPRESDVEAYTSGSTTVYYKRIPEAVKRAVAAQIEYVIEMGDAFFAGDKAEMQSENIGDYGYTKGTGIGALGKLISPKAKLLLKGIFSRVGTLQE